MNEYHIKSIQFDVIQKLIVGICIILIIMYTYLFVHGFTSNTITPIKSTTNTEIIIEQMAWQNDSCWGGF